MVLCRTPPVHYKYMNIINTQHTLGSPASGTERCDVPLAKAHLLNVGISLVWVRLQFGVVVIIYHGPCSSLLLDSRVILPIVWKLVFELAALGSHVERKGSR